MDDEDYEFESSPLSGLFTCDGHEVEVEIYRLAGTQDRWRMEVIHFSGCTRWQDTFATDVGAHARPSSQRSRPPGSALSLGIGPRR